MKKNTIAELARYFYQTQNVRNKEWIDTSNLKKIPVLN